VNVKHVENTEDYRDWQADKIMHEALKSRAVINKTHSFEELCRMWLEHVKADSVLSPTPQTNTGGRNG
jgi:hypothetical protein